MFLLADKSIASAGGGTRWRNLLLVAASLLFYFWGEGRGVLLLVTLAVLNLGLGKLLLTVSEHRCRVVLVGGIVLNLLVLFFYKYLFWVMSSATQWLSLPPVPHIHDRALPLGISFFTFHAVSYLVDLYKGKIGRHTGLDFLTYYFMFPHLVAGPIVRFADVQTDIDGRGVSGFDRSLFIWGVWRFIVGLNKKVLIANSVAPIADIAFHNLTGDVSMGTAWLGMAAYTVQIYFDFSGYSDMAIGLAAMAGIRFHENFNAPYTSVSIRDFWRRWHMSLSSWLRDYVYIPLGGSRCSTVKLYRNLLIVFLLCGIWHGAQSTFVLWGLFHGGFLILERTRFGRWVEALPKWVQHGYCLLIVMLGWVLFRAENLPQALGYWQSLVMGMPTLDIPTGWLNVVALAAGCLIALFGRRFYLRQDAFAPVVTTWLYAVNLLLFVLSLMVLYSGTRNPFIYFNF